MGCERRYIDYSRWSRTMAAGRGLRDRAAAYHLRYLDVVLGRIEPVHRKADGALDPSARAFAHLAEEHGCITQVSFQRRDVPMVVQLREECLERGPIVHAVAVLKKRHRCLF